MKRFLGVFIGVVLYLAFLGIYVWTLYAMLPWARELIVVTSFFAFIPMLPFLIPFYSPMMLANSRLFVLLGYGCSLTASLYLVYALNHYPLKVYMEGDMPDKEYTAIIASLTSYLLISTCLFVYRLLCVWKRQASIKQP